MDITPESTRLHTRTGEEDLISSLTELSDTNRENLKQSEKEFEPHTWEQLQEIVGMLLQCMHRRSYRVCLVFFLVQADRDLDFVAGARQFHRLKRYPSELRRYLLWSSQIKKDYGSIFNFVCRERMHWPSSKDANNPLGVRDEVPFRHPDDYKILRNDWPYAVPSDVTHLVVWMKTPLASTEDGNLLEVARAQVQEFVDACFVSPIKDRTGLENTDDMVLWFKNWSALQSVGALEHFHCLVKGADEALLNEWTGGSPPDLGTLKDRHGP